MPRYIDIDELLKRDDLFLKIKDPEFWFEHSEKYYIEVNDLSCYADAKAVDAVSFEWLASWTKKYIEKTRSEVGVLSEKAVTVAEAFNEMKYDWRKENESKSTS